MDARTTPQTEAVAGFLTDDALLVVAAFLSLPGLGCALRVNRGWCSLLDEREHLWAAHCDRAWASKEYVVPSLRLMARGAAAAEAEAAARRRELMCMRARELRALLRTENVRVRFGDGAHEWSG